MVTDEAPSGLVHGAIHTMKKELAGLETEIARAWQLRQDPKEVALLKRIVQRTREQLDVLERELSVHHPDD